MKKKTKPEPKQAAKSKLLKKPLLSKKGEGRERSAFKKNTLQPIVAFQEMLMDHFP